MSLTVQAAANDLLSKLGIEGSDPTQAPALAQQDVIIAINWAGQMLQRAGQDYFTRSKITLQLAVGTAMYGVAAPVQAVLGPLRLNNQVPLAALLSRGELDQFDRIFLGQSDYGAALGIPIAYWVEYLTNNAGQGDIETINIYFAPTPGPTIPAPQQVVAEVVDAWQNYSTSQIGSLAYVPVARSYVESIFLPMARLAITRSSQFSRSDTLAQFQADFDLAMEQLGTAGGFPNVELPAMSRKVEA